MKFLYTYRTPDNRQHRDTICAASREAAYAALRSRGIKAGHVDEAPGFFNKLFGKGKRWIAIGLLAIVTIVAIVLAFAYKQEAESAPVEIANAILSATRHQVIGDTAIVEKGIKSGWAEVFAHEGERFLASFAIPGVPAGQRNTNVEEIEAALKRNVKASDLDSIEVRQIKAMVEGMKNELRKFLADGGTIVEYGQRLVWRQNEEIGFYNRAMREVESAQKAGRPQSEVLAIWEKRNRSLRGMGIKLVPMPETGTER